MTAAARKPNPVRTGLIGKIHVAKSQLGLDDATYRAILRRVTGKESAKECSFTELENLKAEMENLGWKPARKAHPRAGTRPLADGEVAAKLRALWISGYHLGVVKDPSEAALAAFVKRATGGKKRGVDALQWLTDADARKAIEAVKAWLAREAGVEWKGNPRVAVARAQYIIAFGHGLVKQPTIEAWLTAHSFPPILSLLDDAALDQTIDQLGVIVRAVKGGQ